MPTKAKSPGFTNSRGVFIVALLVASSVATPDSRHDWLVPINFAVAAEGGSVLKELGIDPITNQERLLLFGCIDAMKVTKRVRPFKASKDGEETLRFYRYQGMDLITRSLQAEIVHQAKIDASKLTVWGIVPRFPVTVEDMSRRFGEFKDLFGIGGVGYAGDMMTVLVTTTRQTVTSISWLCG
jgi:hypothetical protein